MRQQQHLTTPSARIITSQGLEAQSLDCLAAGQAKSNHVQPTSYVKRTHRQGHESSDKSPDGWLIGDRDLEAKGSCSCDTAPRSFCSQPPPRIGRNRPRGVKKRVPCKLLALPCAVSETSQSQIANHACDCGGGYAGGSLDLCAILQRQRMPIICLTPAGQFGRTQLEILSQWHRRARAMTRHSHAILNWTLSQSKQF